MKVLLLHQHFKSPYTGGAIRSYYLAKALVDQGIDVEVITAHRAKYRLDLIDGISVHYLNVPYDNSFGFIRRIFAFLQFVRKAAIKAGTIQKVDLCYAMSVPLTVGIAARLIKKRYNIRYIFEVGDLWPEAPIQMGVIKNAWLRNYLYGLERKIYASANAIVALSPAIKLDIESKIKDKDVVLLPNMSDTEFFRKSTKMVSHDKIRDLEGKFVISYIGALGDANGLDYYLSCADGARKAGLPIHFVLCGEGAHKDRLTSAVKALDLKNMSILDFTNRDGVQKILDITDACFVCYKPLPILETGSPNKYFDALAAGKLIIINFCGWIKEEIEQEQCGIYVDPLQPPDFVKQIKPFIADPILLDNYKFRSRSLAEKKYSRKELGQKFYQLIKNSINN